MRVLFTRNHHVPISERSRRMYKAGREYEVADDVANAAVEAKRAKPIDGDGKRSNGKDVRHALAQ